MAYYLSHVNTPSNLPFESVKSKMYMYILSYSMVVTANNEGGNLKYTPCSATKGGLYSKLGNIP